MTLACGSSKVGDSPPESRAPGLFPCRAATAWCWKIKGASRGLYWNRPEEINAEPARFLA